MNTCIQRDSESIWYLLSAGDGKTISFCNHKITHHKLSSTYRTTSYNIRHIIMKISLLSTAILASSAKAFIPATNNNQISTTSLRAEIGETGVQFENVAREWRCKVRRLVHKDPSKFSMCMICVAMRW